MYDDIAPCVWGTGDPALWALRARDRGEVETADRRGGDFPARWGTPPPGRFSEERAAWVRGNVEIGLHRSLDPRWQREGGACLGEGAGGVRLMLARPAPTSPPAPSESPSRRTRIEGGLAVPIAMGTGRPTRAGQTFAPSGRSRDKES